jgi:hypothetical protein
MRVSQPSVPRAILPTILQHRPLRRPLPAPFRERPSASRVHTRRHATVRQQPKGSTWAWHLIHSTPLWRRTSRTARAIIGWRREEP